MKDLLLSKWVFSLRKYKPTLALLFFLNLSSKDRQINAFAKHQAPKKFLVYTKCTVCPQQIHTLPLPVAHYILQSTKQVVEEQTSSWSISHKTSERKLISWIKCYSFFFNHNCKREREKKTPLFILQLTILKSL